MHDWLEAVDQPVWGIAVETYRFTKPNLDMQQKFFVTIEAELNSRMWGYPYISFHFIIILELHLAIIDHLPGSPYI